MSTPLTVLAEQLDNLELHLQHSLSQLHLAMKTLADAAKVAPGLTVGLQPLMVMECDVSARLTALQHVKSQLIEVEDDDDLRVLSHQCSMLAHPGMVTVIPNQAQLN